MKSNFPGNALGMTISAALVIYGLTTNFTIINCLGLVCGLYAFFISVEMTIEKATKP